jgi:hypothetical protein
MVNIASSGWLSLVGGTDAARTGFIPSTLAPNGAVAPYWRDQRTRAGGVCVATVGTAPNRRWVVQWNDTGIIDTVAPMDAGVALLDSTHFVYEAILSEGTNLIDFVYQRMDGVRQANAGIENTNGLTGMPGCPDETVFACTPFPNFVARFEPIP